MKKLNKDSSVIKNSVEAYECSSCSFCKCSCDCSFAPQYEGSIRSGQLISPAVYQSTNVRQ